MNVNNKITNKTTSPYDNIKSSTKAEKADESKVMVSKDTDVYIPSSESTIKTYTRDNVTINRLKLDAEKQTKQLRDIVEKLIMQQGEKDKETGLVEIDDKTRLKAQEDISDEGFWGVENTSQRIIDFAKSLVGGDPSKAEEMKDTFIKGFKAAEEAWGGKLPEISYKTYDATIKLFDEWSTN